MVANGWIEGLTVAAIIVGTVMGGVLIRANDKCALDFHIDTDDGNAFLLKQGQLVTVLGKEE